MSITNEQELIGMKKISEVVAYTLKEMIAFAAPGMSTKTLDNYGKDILESYGASSAPFKTYGFPGWTCISVDKEFCHGIPSEQRILEEGQLINIDVSAELNGFWSDNGSSFIVGNTASEYDNLVQASREILQQTIAQISGGVRISDVGEFMEKSAKQRGYRVIKNLTGHGVGRSLHEAPHEIANFRDRFNRERFKKNTTVAIETFIATDSSEAITLKDGWTMVGNKGGYMAQHEHTILVTGGKPVILTSTNGI